MTRINLFDHSCGLRDAVDIPIPRDILIDRLRAAIGAPQFEICDRDEFSVYARIDCELITVHLDGWPATAVAAGWNKIAIELNRRALT